MTALWTREDFEGAAAGVTISTSNTGFDAVSVAGGTMQFSTAVTPISGTRVMVVSGTPATQGRWGSFAAKSYVCISFYIYVDTYGGSATVIATCKNASNTNRAQLRLTDSGGTPLLGIRNGTTQVTAGSAMATGQWHRVDWELDYTNSVQRVWRYTGANLHSTNTGDADYASGNQTFNTGTIERFTIGHDTAVANANTIYWDMPGGDDAAMPAPVVSSVDADFITTVGEATADGGSTTFSGDAGFASTAGEATADGGSSPFSGAASFITSVATATADGGSTSFLAGVSFTTLVGVATADGGSTSFQGDATFETTVGEATADGGVSDFLADGAAVFSTTVGEAFASGGESTFYALAPTLIRLSRITAHTS